MSSYWLVCPQHENYWHILKWKMLRMKVESRNKISRLFESISENSGRKKFLVKFMNTLYRKLIQWIWKFWFFWKEKIDTRSIEDINNEITSQTSPKYVYNRYIYFCRTSVHLHKLKNENAIIIEENWNKWKNRRLFLSLSKKLIITYAFDLC